MEENQELTDFEPIIAEQNNGFNLSETPTIDQIISAIIRKERNLSYSSFSNFAETPMDFVKYMMKTFERTEAMIYGAMVHCLVLEPKDFYNRYFVLDDVEKKKEIGGAKPGGTKEYKMWVEEMAKNAAGKELVKTADWSLANSISIGVRTNKAAARILKLCPEREQEILWQYNNFAWKGFKDGNSEHAIFDLKTVQDANVRKVQRDMINNGWYLQAAMYLTGDAENGGKGFDKDYYIIAVDKKGGISCHQMKKDLINYGRQQYKYFSDKFNECILADAWSESYEFFADRHDGIYDASKPGWM